jgi:alanine racemase
MSQLTARTWAEVNLGALRHNVRVARERAGGAAIMAVIKANAYGHGVRAVARSLYGQVEMFGVASVREGLEIKADLPAARIHILGAALPEEREVIVREKFTPSISTFEEARAFGELRSDGSVPVHLVVDTGMGRMGVWQEEAAAFARRIAALPGIRVTGVATHLPVADEDEDFTREELRAFEKCLSELQRILGRELVIHVLNSAGVLRFGQAAQTMVRAGLMLYGSSPIPELQRELRPALVWKTRVILVRDVAEGRGISYGRTFITPRPMRVATLAVGYADGFQRHLSGKGAEVLIGGRRCALLGRVTMDQIMVDVTGVKDAAVGDEAVLIGRQGEEEILVAELAAKSGTIAWEIFTGLGQRVQRVWHDESLGSERAAP